MEQNVAVGDERARVRVDSVVVEENWLKRSGDSFFFLRNAVHRKTLF